MNNETNLDSVYDISIIGGGIIGASLARELMRYRLKVLLLEKDPDVAMGATKANSAIVHGGYAESHQTLKGRLCYQGRRKYPQLEAELNFGFSACGSLVVAFHDGDIDELSRLRDNGVANGLPPEELEIWGRDQLLERVPGISTSAVAALYCAGAGICSPYVMTIAMAENAVKNGLELRLNEGLVKAVQDEDSLFLLETSRQRQYKSRRVVNCAGLGAEAVAAMFGISAVSLYGRSGQYILLDRGTDSLLPYVLFGMPTHLGKGILLSPTIHGNLIIGPDANELRDLSADEAATAGLETDEDRLLKIWQQGNELFPALPAAKIIRDFAGVRAASTSGDFMIGRDPEGLLPGYYQAVGIQSPGLTAAPAIADMLIDEMQADGLHLVANPNFDPLREAYIRPLASKSQTKQEESRPPLPPSELESLLKLEPEAVGRMICRCEQVSEAAVSASLHQGLEIKTIDAVKRRSRAGMGRCQGSYCRSRVVDVLSRELGLDSAEIDSRTDIERIAVSRVGAARLKQAIREQEAAEPEGSSSD